MTYLCKYSLRRRLLADKYLRKCQTALTYPVLNQAGL